MVDKSLDERFKSKEVQNASTELVQNLRSYMSFALKIIKENQLEKEYGELVEEAKKFNKSYVHMKGNEITYANKCKALCKKFDMVILYLIVDV